jgi:hypothetical protein
MPQLPFKLMLFLGLWHEIAGQFRLGPDAAFLLTMFVFYGGWLAQRFIGEFAGMPEELTAALAVRGIIWIVLFCWLAPDFLRALPWSFIVAGLVAIVLTGMRCREQIEHYGYRWGRELCHAHSEATVGVVSALLSLAYFSQQFWGSILPLVGYVALVGLPFSFGWMGGAAVEPRYDASLGDEDTFRDAGVSDEY